MIKLRILAENYKKKFSEIGIKNASHEVNWIIEEAADIFLGKKISLFKDQLTKKDIENITFCLDKRLERVPISRIFQKSYFRNLELFLCNHNFIPRIDSEFLIDVLFKKKIVLNNVLELGTGSGAIIISLLKETLNIRAIATDISYEAIYMAKKNAIINGVENKVQFICCNWLDSFVNLDFDLIIANPPYIKSEDIYELEPEVKNYDPIIALDGGFDGLDVYRNICGAIKEKRKKKIAVLFEIGYDQASEVSSIMKNNNFMELEIFKDYENNDRCIFGISN